MGPRLERATLRGLCSALAERARADHAQSATGRAHSRSGLAELTRAR
jgi:hypothetical protein